MIDSDWIAAVLLQVQALLAPQDPFFSFSQVCFRREWWSAARVLKIQEWLGPPHTIRHSRPSREILQGTRTLEEVRRRGRWRSLKSVQRYTKSFLLIKAMSDTPADVRRMGEEFLADPFGVLVKELRSHSAARDHLFGRAILTAAGVSRQNSRGSSAREATPERLRSAGELSGHTVHELRTLCRARGLPAGGRKADLVQRLARSHPGAGPPSRQPDLEDRTVG